VILTHFHGDHTFNTSHYSDCDIIASKNTHENLKNRIEESELYQKQSIKLPNITFDEEYQIDDKGQILLTG
jgi:glyoxylase-like metal-dependent hydrolase (beta-lactamase superfamily II)